MNLALYPINKEHQLQDAKELRATTEDLKLASQFLHKCHIFIANYVTTQPRISTSFRSVHYNLPFIGVQLLLTRGQEESMFSESSAHQAPAECCSPVIPLEQRTLLMQELSRPSRAPESPNSSYWNGCFE